MDYELQETLMAYLETLATPERQTRIDTVLQERTRFITVVLEDLYQSHNGSAVMRSCEALGVQDIHTIENENSFSRTRKIDMGSQKWLTLHRHRLKGNSDQHEGLKATSKEAQENTRRTLESLQQQGYQLVATTPPSEISISLEDFLPTQKSAILFGTELTGLSKTAMEMADVHLTIPMYGFVESFNISVSCAVILQKLVSGLRSSKTSWGLTQKEIRELRFGWLMQSVAHGEKMVDHYLTSTLNLPPLKEIRNSL